MAANMSKDALAEKHLLTAVVAHAVRDACMPPIVKKTKRKEAARIRGEVFSAIVFLFDKERAGLDAYAAWLDFDAEQFRLKLLRACHSERVTPDLHLDDNQRRNFRANYKLYNSMPHHRLEDIEVEEGVDG